eukprot:GHUV01012448.1.p1 GENE.GHUV01012448.1~~GHUV01012448.1.p1  ORF type:complete len:158 (+),score=35.24 GHUV01012448.1:34-507(+)
MKCVAARTDGGERATAVRSTAAAPSTVASHRRLKRQQQLTSNIPLQIVATIAPLLVCTSANAAVQDSFAVKCAGCHINGGNIVQAGATLFTPDLIKNNVADSDSLYKLIYEGKGRMPGFGQECTPRGKCTFGPRLTDEEVRGMAQYVLDKAGHDWKQ